MRQIVLDTETTGLEPEGGHRIIEIGCVELVNRRPTSQYFHRYINPKRAVDLGALEVHGIDDDFLSTQPEFNQIAQEAIHNYYLRKNVCYSVGETSKWSEYKRF